MSRDVWWSSGQISGCFSQEHSEGVSFIQKVNLVSLSVPATLTSLLDPSADDVSTTMLHCRDAIGQILSLAHIPNIMLRIKSLWSALGRSMEATVLLGTFSALSAAFLSSTGGLSIWTGRASVLVAVPLWDCLRYWANLQECHSPCWLTISHFNDIGPWSLGIETEKNWIE